MDRTVAVRCPCCKKYFAILMTGAALGSKVHVIGEPSKPEKSGFVQGAKSHHPHGHTGDPYQCGKDILRANAAKHATDQEKYPPNMPLERRRDDLEESE